MNNLISIKTGTPSWYNAGSITESFDSREMLERGEHPVAMVLKKAAEISQGEIYELITPFPPTPLIEKVRAMGFDSFSNQISGNEVRTYFYKF